MKLITYSDMGSIKIYNDSLSCFFDNGFGDGENIVEVFPNKTSKYRQKEYIGHFTVKAKAFLSLFDCTDDSIYEFGTGRWFVYLVKPRHFVIQKVDNYMES